MKDCCAIFQILVKFALNHRVLFVFQSNAQLELTMEKQQKLDLQLS